jgi:hypothetical protein
LKKSDFPLENNFQGILERARIESGGKAFPDEARSLALPSPAVSGEKEQQATALRRKGYLLDISF